MKDLDDNNDARDYLGIEIFRNRDNKTLRLSQKAYFQRVLTRYNLEKLNGISAPIRKGLRFYLNNIDYVNDEEKHLY
jgi:hypothetical protein